MSRIINYPIQIGLLLIPFVLPIFTLNDSNGTLLTAVSLLFAILVGFFIATTTSNYLRLQTLIADANAGLISLRNLISRIEPSKKQIVEQAIDEYMIATLDYELLDYTDKTKREFNNILKIADEIEPQGNVGLTLFQELHVRMDEMLTNDQEISLTSKKIVTPRHWFIIILLSILLATSLLSFRDGTLIMSIFVSIMFVSIYHIMILIHEIDTNLFLSNQLSFEDPQQVFYGIGRDYYYPEYSIKKGYAKPSSDVYRIGIYKDFPNSLEKEIKLVKRN